jgi:hypothetical protein
MVRLHGAFLTGGRSQQIIADVDRGPLRLETAHGEVELPAPLGDPWDQCIPGEGAAGARFLNTALGAAPAMMPRRINLMTQELVWKENLRIY